MYWDATFRILSARVSSPIFAFAQLHRSHRKRVQRSRDLGCSQLFRERVTEYNPSGRIHQASTITPFRERERERERGREREREREGERGEREAGRGFHRVWAFGKNP